MEAIKMSSPNMNEDINTSNNGNIAKEVFKQQTEDSTNSMKKDNEGQVNFKLSRAKRSIPTILK